MNDNEPPNPDDARARPDPLTRLLRDADPATDAPGLDPTEVAQMRRAITSAARKGNDSHRAPIAWPAWMQPLPMRPAWLSPAVALATIGIVALGLWVVAGQLSVMPDQPAVSSDRPPAIADQPAVIPAQPVAAAADPQAMTVPVPSPGEALAATVAATNDPSPPDVRTRTVQFTAPRGTRIIWTLDPDFVSLIAGPEARQEQGK